MSMTPAAFRELFPEIARHCGPGGLDDLLESLEAQDVQAGQSVTTDGEYSDSLFFVISGKLVSQITSDTETIRLGSIRKGECFGEVNILDPGPSTSSVIATVDSTVLALSHDTLRKLDKVHPKMTGNILRMLSTILIDRCRVADKLLFSKYAPIESIDKTKSRQHPGLVEWGRDILQKLHGHKGKQP